MPPSTCRRRSAQPSGISTRCGYVCDSQPSARPPRSVSAFLSPSMREGSRTSKGTPSTPTTPYCLKRIGFASRCVSYRPRVALEEQQGRRSSRRKPAHSPARNAITSRSVSAPSDSKPVGMGERPVERRLAIMARGTRARRSSCGSDRIARLARDHAVDELAARRLDHVLGGSGLDRAVRVDQERQELARAGAPMPVRSGPTPPRVPAPFAVGNCRSSARELAPAPGIPGTVDGGSSSAISFACRRSRRRRASRAPRWRARPWPRPGGCAGGAAPGSELGHLDVPGRERVEQHRGRRRPREERGQHFLARRPREPAEARAQRARRLRAGRERVDHARLHLERIERIQEAAGDLERTSAHLWQREERESAERRSSTGFPSSLATFVSRSASASRPSRRFRLVQRTLSGRAAIAIWTSGLQQADQGVVELRRGPRLRGRVHAPHELLQESHRRRGGLRAVLRERGDDLDGEPEPPRRPRSRRGRAGSAPEVRHRCARRRPQAAGRGRDRERPSGSSRP